MFSLLGGHVPGLSPTLPKSTLMPLCAQPLQNTIHYDNNSDIIQLREAIFSSTTFTLHILPPPPCRQSSSTDLLSHEVEQLCHYEITCISCLCYQEKKN